ncbi:MAG: plastocyanin/azurin family copper-binding protein [Dehalococcoidia bacterium]
MRRLLLVGLLSAALVFVATGLGYAAPARATIGIRYSHFDTNRIEVRAGEPITITLRNDDPIDHEWIVGDSDVHARHRTGNEPYHDSVPTEVTIPALSTRVTTITFDQAGEYVYICHLPGHEAYGMVGTLRVVER